MADNITFPPVTAPATSAARAPAQAVGGFTPADATPKQLDNPLRTRVTGAAPVQTKVHDPFSGLSFVDILNIRAAMSARISSLAAGQEDNAVHIASSKRILALATQKLSPRIPQEGAVALPALSLPATAANAVPMVPLSRP